jgi:hypothetical protein
MHSSDAPIAAPVASVRLGAWEEYGGRQRLPWLCVLAITQSLQIPLDHARLTQRREGHQHLLDAVAAGAFEGVGDVGWGGRRDAPR